ncbi:MAG: glycosyltransferase [Proteobacteria bacterium]|nr:glycosyltransferase [Pseudomonadota bacterium]
MTAARPAARPALAEPDPEGAAAGIVGVVVKGYPRLSETFIAQELRGLEARGLRLQIISLRHPYDPTTHPIHDEIAAPVSYLPEYLWREPRRVLRSWWAARRLAGYRRARAKFWRDLRRDPTPNRIRRFGQACVLACEADPSLNFLYAHFLHTPASVARYSAAMLGLPFAVSAHAKDIWTTPEWEKREKIKDTSWLTTCTANGADHLRQLDDSATKTKVYLNYHGLDLERFPPRSADDRKADTDLIALASVGRLVEKKGYGDLIAALALLPPELNWRLTHIGGGPLAATLAAQAEHLGIAGKIEWLGRQSQSKVQEILRLADIFVLASKIADDGDRDGLPNVLMEAQSQSLPCIATAVSAIPELIEDGVNGRLVAPGDRPALAAAIAELAGDPALRDRLAERALAKLRADFQMDGGHDAIAALIAAASANAHAVPA